MARIGGPAIAYPPAPGSPAPRRASRSARARPTPRPECRPAVRESASRVWPHSPPTPEPAPARRAATHQRGHALAEATRWRWPSSAATSRINVCAGAPTRPVGRAAPALLQLLALICAVDTKRSLAQRLQPRQRLLRQRQALPLQFALGLDLRNLPAQAGQALGRRCLLFAAQPLASLQGLAQTLLASPQAALHPLLRIAVAHMLVERQHKQHVAGADRLRPCTTRRSATVAICGDTSRIQPRSGTSTPAHEPCACTRPAPAKRQPSEPRPPERRPARSSTAVAPGRTSPIHCWRCASMASRRNSGVMSNGVQKCRTAG